MTGSWACRGSTDPVEEVHVDYYLYVATRMAEILFFSLQYFFLYFFLLFCLDFDIIDP